MVDVPVPNEEQRPNPSPRTQEARAAIRNRNRHSAGEAFVAQYLDSDTSDNSEESNNQFPNSLKEIIDTEDKDDLWKIASLTTVTMEQLQEEGQIEKSDSLEDIAIKIADRLQTTIHVGLRDPDSLQEISEAANDDQLLVDLRDQMRNNEKVPPQQFTTARVIHHLLNPKTFDEWATEVGYQDPNDQASQAHEDPNSGKMQTSEATIPHDRNVLAEVDDILNSLPEGEFTKPQLVKAINAKLKEYRDLGQSRAFVTAIIASNHRLMSQFDLSKEQYIVIDGLVRAAEQFSNNPVRALTQAAVDVQAGDSTSLEDVLLGLAESENPTQDAQDIFDDAVAALVNTGRFDSQAAQQLITKAITQLRPKDDNLRKTHAELVRATGTDAEPIRTLSQKDIDADTDREARENFQPEMRVAIDSFREIEDATSEITSALENGPSTYRRTHRATTLAVYKNNFLLPENSGPGARVTFIMNLQHDLDTAQGFAAFNGLTTDQLECVAGIEDFLAQVEEAGGPAQASVLFSEQVEEYRDIRDRVGDSIPQDKHIRDVGRVLAKRTSKQEARQQVASALQIAQERIALDGNVQLVRNLQALLDSRALR